MFTSFILNSHQSFCKTNFESSFNNIAFFTNKAVNLPTCEWEEVTSVWFKRPQTISCINTFLYNTCNYIHLLQKTLKRWHALFLCRLSIVCLSVITKTLWEQRTSVFNSHWLQLKLKSELQSLIRLLAITLLESSTVLALS